MKYNKPFFTALQNTFLTLKEAHGTEEALRLFRKIMERNLAAGYADIEVGEKNAENFKRVVGVRDRAVGLRVTFHKLKNGFVYRFHTDPFPNLRSHVEPHLLDATYLDFKLRHLLGEGWTYRTTKHLWKGDKYTEHVFERVK